MPVKCLHKNLVLSELGGRGGRGGVRGCGGVTVSERTGGVGTMRAHACAHVQALVHEKRRSHFPFLFCPSLHAHVRALCLLFQFHFKVLYRKDNRLQTIIMAIPDRSLFPPHTLPSTLMNECLTNDLFLQWTAEPVHSPTKGI